MRKLLMAAAFALPMFGTAAMAQETVKIAYIDHCRAAPAWRNWPEDSSIHRRGVERQGRCPARRSKSWPSTTNQSAGEPDRGPEGDRSRDPDPDSGATVPRLQARSPILSRTTSASRQGSSLFNYAAVDPVLTNDKCSFWHFRWDAELRHQDGGAHQLHEDRDRHQNVYLINQDDLFGRSVNHRQVDARRQAAGHQDRR